MNDLLAQIQTQLDAKDAQIATEQASIAALNTQIAQLLNPWIRCSDRLPEPDQKVDVWHVAGERIADVAWTWCGGSEGYWDWVFIGDHHADGECFQEHGLVDDALPRHSEITHWMPLPSPPTA